MITQDHPLTKQQKIDLCVYYCPLPDCDQYDPRCPYPCADKRQTREDKIARRIAGAALREARRECRR